MEAKTTRSSSRAPWPSTAFAASERSRQGAASNSAARAGSARSGRAASVLSKLASRRKRQALEDLAKPVQLGRVALRPDLRRERVALSRHRVDLEALG